MLGFIWSSRKGKVAFTLFIVAIAVAAVVLVNQDLMFGDEAKLTLVGFDEAAADSDMRYLTGLGPRPAGSDAEMQGAEYVASVFEDLGLETTIHTYEMKVFEVASAHVALVKYGPLKRKPLFASPGYIKEYEHLSEFVLMGFSGSRVAGTGPSAFRGDLSMTWVGNGTEEGTDWSACSNMAAIVTQEEGTPSATEILRAAMENGCAAVILHNTMYTEELDYIPIFKGIYFADDEPDPDIPILMVSKAVGDEILSARGDSKLRLDISVIVENRPVPVTEGILKGSGGTDEWVAIGGHMDSVYNGPGAVDNTAGTVAVLGLARAMANETPKRAIRFLAFGAEETGLKGAGAYVEGLGDEVDNCIFMFNLDMPNIDIERGNTGWIGSDDNATIGTMKRARDRLTSGEARYAKYDIAIEYHGMVAFSDNAMFALQGVPASFAVGSGSIEYHTYMDDISRINSESIGLEGRIVGSTALYIANE